MEFYKITKIVNEDEIKLTKENVILKLRNIKGKILLNLERLKMKKYLAIYKRGTEVGSRSDDHWLLKQQ